MIYVFQSACSLQFCCSPGCVYPYIQLWVRARTWQTEPWVVFFFFICSVLPLQRSQKLNCREKGNTHQFGFFSKANPSFFFFSFFYFSTSAHEKQSDGFFSPPPVIIFLKFVEWVPESLRLGGNLPLFSSILVLTAHCQVAAGGFGKGGREGSAGYQGMAVLNSLIDSAPCDTWISSSCFFLLQKNCTFISRCILQECFSISYLSST